MVLGDHGRKFLYPYTLSQKFAHFPWKKLYNNSMYFRALCGTGVALSAGWLLVILKGKTILTQSLSLLTYLDLI